MVSSSDQSSDEAARKKYGKKKKTKSGGSARSSRDVRADSGSSGDEFVDQSKTAQMGRRIRRLERDVAGIKRSLET